MVSRLKRQARGPRSWSLSGVFVGGSQVLGEHGHVTVQFIPQGPPTFRTSSLVEDACIHANLPVNRCAKMCVLSGKLTVFVVWAAKCSQKAYFVFISCASLYCLFFSSLPQI